MPETSRSGVYFPVYGNRQQRSIAALTLDFWRSIDGFGRGSVCLLAAMLVNTIVAVCHKFYQYSIARRQTRAFTSDTATAMCDGRFDEVLAIAERNRLSHSGTVVGAGLNAFASTPPQSNHAEAIEAAERAMRRSRKKQHAALKIGLATFATIASSAPFIGLLGTCFGILYAFRGTGMEAHQWLIRVNSEIANALVTSATGLFVGILAMWCRNYQRNRVEVFEADMANASIETVMYLNAHRQWRNQTRHVTTGPLNSMSILTDDLADGSWEVPYDRQHVLLLAVWTSWLYIALYTALRPVLPGW